MNTTEHSASILEAEDAARQRPDDYAAFEALGYAYFEAERFDKALCAFQNAVALNPATTDAYNGIGHIHYKIGYPPAAIAAYERAIANDPHYLTAYYGLGMLHSSRLGTFEQAIEAFERGLKANPRDPFLTANLGSTYARQGNIEKAIEILKAVTRSAPDDPFAYGWLSILYLHQHRFEQAMATCQKSIELEDNHNPHRMLGYMYHSQGRLDEAISEQERAVELEPDDYEARGALARAYRDSGDLPVSEKHYRLAEQMALKDNEYGQACFHAVSGDFETALDLLEVGLAEGQVLPGWIRIDPEFAFMQDEPRFQALIKPAAAG